MRLMISKSGYTVTGDKALKSFAYTVGKLNDKQYEDNPWTIIIKQEDSIVPILKNSEIIKPKCYYLNDRLYVIIEDNNVDGFHYYVDVDDFPEIIQQINSKKIILFGILDKNEDNIELLLQFVIDF